MAVLKPFVVVTMALSLPLFASEPFVLHQGLPDKAHGDDLFVHTLISTSNSFLVDHATIKIKNLYQGLEAGEINGEAGTKIVTKRQTVVRGHSDSLDFKLFHKESRSEYVRCDGEGCHYLGFHNEDRSDFWHPLMTVSVPRQASIGEEGLIGHYRDDFGSEHHCRWSLEGMDGHEHKARLNITCDELENDKITETSVTTITINKQGHCLALESRTISLDEDKEDDVVVGKGACPRDDYFFRFL